MWLADIAPWLFARGEKRWKGITNCLVVGKGDPPGAYFKKRNGNRAGIRCYFSWTFAQEFEVLEEIGRKDGRRKKKLIWFLS